VDQVPLAVEPPSHVWLAANTLGGASTKTAMAAARILTNRLHLSSAILQALNLCKRPAERGLIVVGRSFMIWGRGFVERICGVIFLN